MQFPLPSAPPTISGTQNPSSSPGPATQPVPATIAARNQGAYNQATQGPGTANQATQGQAVHRTQSYRGWYPRWWLLSALYCAVLIGLIRLLQSFMCVNQATASPFCQLDSWTDWRQGMVVALVWLIFLLGWLLTYVFGVKPIEFKQSRAPLPSFLKAISQFRAVYILLLIYAVVALCAIIVMWLLRAFHPLTFALYSVIIFVANSHFFHRMEREGRLRYLLGYAILAIVCMIVMFIANLFQPVIFGAEAIIVIAGFWSAVALFRSRNQQGQQQLPSDQALAAANERALNPGEVFRDLIYALFHPGA